MTLASVGMKDLLRVTLELREKEKEVGYNKPGWRGELLGKRTVRTKAQNQRQRGRRELGTFKEIKETKAGSTERSLGIKKVV